MRLIVKSILGFIVLSLCILGATWYLVTAPVWTKPEARNPLSDANRLRQHVVTLATDIEGRPYIRPDKLDEAAAYIFDQFEAFGEPRFQEYNLQGRTYKNVTLRLRGTQSCKTRHYVVGAHYDTFGSLPGADDNASGVAGLIELARAIHDTPLPCDVELVAYTLEEPPNFRTCVQIRG